MLETSSDLSIRHIQLSPVAWAISEINKLEKQLKRSVMGLEILYSLKYAELVMSSWEGKVDRW